MKIRNEEYNPIEVEEAGVKFFLPEKDSKPESEKKIGKSMSVFYNPRMTINRDLTICVVNTYSKQRTTKLSYCDSMAATGIRAIRLLKQCPGIEKVHINDLNPIAIETIKNNLELNEVPSGQYKLYTKDAKSLLSHFHEDTDEYFDIIDIDPFGSPCQYIPAAMQSISVSEGGGLLCATATDTPVLFGIKKEACIRKYLTSPIRTDFLKEMGTRIFIYYLAKIANLFELYIKPVISISANHFVRVFLLVRKGILGVNSNIREFGTYQYCRNCLHRSAEKFEYSKSTMKSNLCPICGETMISSGLLWLGDLHNSEYMTNLEGQLADSLIQSFPSYIQMKKFVELAKNENKFPPYFYSIPKLADSLNCTYPSLGKLREHLKELGHNSSRTHFDPQGLKTTASIVEMKNLLKNFQS
ncbi:MAG: tRNA (guanine(10)-N(2))-dimethyltransferase [Promethearchaeota archaeon]|nr:MAG: tRNA (guanine(10)-N(2))-dimethyltransferase [Candidatus Lokiarchaeota archaeon]